MDINKYDPKFKLRRRDLLGLSDLTSEEIFELLYAAKAMKKMGEAHGVELPITEAVYEACFLSHAFESGDGAKECMNIILKLFDRATKSEF